MPSEVQTVQTWFELLILGTAVIVGFAAWCLLLCVAVQALPRETETRAHPMPRWWTHATEDYGWINPTRFRRTS